MANFFISCNHTKYSTEKLLDLQLKLKIFNYFQGGNNAYTTKAYNLDLLRILLLAFVYTLFLKKVLTAKSITRFHIQSVRRFYPNIHLVDGSNLILLDPNYLNTKIINLIYSELDLSISG